MKGLVDDALAFDRRSVSRLLRYFEDRRAAAAPTRGEILALLESHPGRRRSVFVGITGTPGSGKSTLVGEVARRLLEGDAVRSVAVVAVDPTSHFSGGSLLGDRTRVRTATADARFFFRSQPTQDELGGLGPTTFQVCRLLHHLYDFVFVETVGIGQSEIDIRYLADRVYLVLQPLGGDEIQFLKAGVMEIPDAVILNKSDEEEASRRSYFALRNSLELARPFEGREVSIHRTSARTGVGLDELAEEVGGLGAGEALRAREPYFFEKWVEHEWGRTGLRYLADGAGGTGTYLEACGSYDDAQARFGDGIRAWLRQAT